MDQQGIADRRRLRRKLTFWRVAAFVVAVVGVVDLVASTQGSDPISGKSTEPCVLATRPTTPTTATTNAATLQKVSFRRRRRRSAMPC